MTQTNSGVATGQFVARWSSPTVFDTHIASISEAHRFYVTEILLAGDAQQKRKKNKNGEKEIKRPSAFQGCKEEREPKPPDVEQDRVKFIKFKAIPREKASRQKGLRTIEREKRLKLRDLGGSLDCFSDSFLDCPNKSSLSGGQVARSVCRNRPQRRHRCLFSPSFCVLCARVCLHESVRVKCYFSETPRFRKWRSLCGLLPKVGDKRCRWRCRQV